jgi:hypothetical protein
MAAGILRNPVNVAGHPAARVDSDADLFCRLLLPLRLPRDFDRAVRAGSGRSFLVCRFRVALADVPEAGHARGNQRDRLCSLPLVLAYANRRAGHT